MNNKLRKSSTDRGVVGVCGGIADYFGISSLGVRLIFIFLPANFVIYLILATILPDSPLLL
ncbi:PspC domain-containing protein [Oceanobacillus caeni]|uniref:Phage-shock protein n=1 Tax=Oceanobacillus caeni TaxID=405946 RepID=A0ABR5MME2_9BACI|nr:MULTISPECIES: PspC domain-containing protein [Bacillaceae]KKE80745.1 phage-shock protein [Bacilli bacterium VT-13-104]OJH20034.1 PspC domain-containing protein [Bacillus obstructivus]PZD83118.1 PspC domain-containing protein [Bacilli bacterium]KPH77622.1 phage-shock protein [Oceanobacillus caeni]MBU8792526.1 PspC domain-containing protein [Oceanobacillus caeni]